MTEKLYFSKALKDDHIFRLTDDTGMLQHSKYALPDPNHGYTTDDNARALIMALMLYGRFKKKEYLDLVYRYASFLLNAQNDSGKFKNFMGYDRKWLEEEESEDCFGRCLWALGYALSNDNTPTGVKQGLSSILKNAMPHVTGLNWLRAKAYSIIGLSCLENKDTTRLVFQIAQSLCSQYDEHRDGEWKWFEENVTYCNNVLPWSLLAAYRVTGEKRFWEVAGESLQFLESITFKDGYFKPVGCDGWLPKGGKIAEFDEQTVEACEAVLTYMEAYEITKDKRFLKKAKKCHAWYEGANSKGISLIDSETGGCYDGLTPQGLNLNMGAESLVSYIISYLKISEIE
ncbi:MAG TPA: glycosyltransferase [Acetivibrio sp.]|nr:glycosyltransferase [Acetivibrio sp.]